MTRDENAEPDEDGIAPVRFVQSSAAANALIIDGPGVGAYGRIVRCVTFNEAFDVAALRQKAAAWIASQTLGGITIDISAADLRFLDASKGAFYLGMGVPVDSPPHGVSETLIITKIEADIVKVSKKITLGRLSEKTLSDVAGRGGNRYEVGVKPRKVSSKKKIKAADSGILFIPA